MTSAEPVLSNSVASIADALRAAEAMATPINPPTDGHPGLTVEDAYAIAQHNVALRVGAGERVVGHKVGLTAEAIQQQLGVDQPDFGALLDTMRIADGGTAQTGELIAPRVELELAFHLSLRLAGPGITVEDVRAATAHVQPAIELVDSRVIDWRIKLVDTVADAASSARFVLGGVCASLDEIEVRNVEMELERNGQIVERGNTSAVLGDPCASVAWLANALGAMGVTLEPGHVILSGSGTRVAPAAPGDTFVGHFGTLGSVTLNFSAPR
jgi:2-keto-4-pentenoate hydratase